MAAREQGPAWPPDLIAIAGTLIRRSGVYLRVFERRDRSDYVDNIAKAAREWRQKVDEISTDAKVVRPADLKSKLTLRILYGIPCEALALR